MKTKLISVRSPERLAEKVSKLESKGWVTEGASTMSLAGKDLEITFQHQLMRKDEVEDPVKEVPRVMFSVSVSYPKDKVAIHRLLHYSLNNKWEMTTYGPERHLQTRQILPKEISSNFKDVLPEFMRLIGEWTCHEYEVETKGLEGFMEKLRTGQPL